MQIIERDIETHTHEITEQNHLREVVEPTLIHELDKGSEPPTEQRNDENVRADTFAVQTASAAALIGMAGVVLALPQAARAISPALTFSASIPGKGDVQVLNYALVLEELEAALYVQVLLRLSDLGITSGQIVQILQEFSVVEADHATFLRTTLNSVVAQNASLGPVVGTFTYNFGLTTSVTDARSALELILMVEATGVRAYLGAIPLLSAQSPYLQVAAAIQETEARHTTTLTIARNVNFSTGSDVAPLYTERTPVYDAPYDTLHPNQGTKGLDVYLHPDTVLAAVSPFIVGQSS